MSAVYGILGLSLLFVAFGLAGRTARRTKSCGSCPESGSECEACPSSDQNTESSHVTH